MQDETDVDPELRTLLEAAIARRTPLAEDESITIYRLVNGAGDDLPGYAVDLLEDVLVVHVYDDTLDADPVVDALIELVDPLRAVYVKRRPRQAGGLTDVERAALAPSEPVWGNPVEAILARENGVEYELRPGEGFGYGIFPDMRKVRAWVGEHAREATLLNLFAYTSAFGVCAARGGAVRTLNLDASRHYLDWGKANYEHNALPADDRDFVYGDAFDWLGRFARPHRGERFDLVIVDPPGFARTRSSRFSAERDLWRLVAAATPVVAERGILVVACNVAGISDRQFNAHLQAGFAEAGRYARTVEAWHEPDLDFPTPTSTDDSRARSARDRHASRHYLHVAALALDA